jgi:hypothetical protein
MLGPVRMDTLILWIEIISRRLIGLSNESTDARCMRLDFDGTNANVVICSTDPPQPPESSEWYRLAAHDFLNTRNNCFLRRTIIMRGTLRERCTLRFVAGFILCCAFLECTSSAFSLSSETAQDAIRSQLGYLPSNFMSVSAWKENSMEPVAIRAYPLHGGAKRRQEKSKMHGNDNSPVSSPFPTLYWLTCPDISRAVADLERRGYIQRFEASLRADSGLAHRLVCCHEEYAKQRWNTLTEEDRSLLLTEDSSSMLRMRNMMQFSGISGTNFTKPHAEKEEDHGILLVAPLKCLHAHYAHFRSTMMSPAEECTQNPVGEMIHKQLAEEFPDLQL